MKNHTTRSTAIVILILASLYTATAQPRFTILEQVPATPVKDQDHTGTCWCFATTSFIESELIRMGKGEQDLAESYFVRMAYEEKAMKYVRLHGRTNFSNGGLSMDVMYLWNKYGALPQSAYPGQTWGGPLPDHREMDAVLKAYVERVATNPGETLTPVWLEGFRGILDAYLGAGPGNCAYSDDLPDPVEFAKKTGLDPDAYVAVGSYTHHPFYTKFPLEIPDNWLWNSIYNVPIDELVKIVDHALSAGYSVCWDGDVGEIGFSGKTGLAMIPVYDPDELERQEREQWKRLSGDEKRDRFYDFFQPGMEVSITQELRQEWFNNRKTTDDHLMHITGIARDQDGKHYYRIKNSWGLENQGNDGYVYASGNYLRGKTIFIMVHRDALPEGIAGKLGL
jgi:bleomycin hydrolase